MECIHCNSLFTIKKGTQNGSQQYQCKKCKKYFRSNYKIKRISKLDEQYLIQLLKWGNSIRGMAFFTGFSHVSIMRTLIRISQKINPPTSVSGQIYKVDEIQTFIALKKRRKKKRSKKKKNKCWITYAINKQTGEVFNFVTGKRSKLIISGLTNELLKTFPTKVYTDGLNLYPGLISKEVHETYPRCTNKIERYNLTLRNHMKRLSRKTLSFNRSQNMLEACLKIYFFAN